MKKLKIPSLLGCLLAVLGLIPSIGSAQTTLFFEGFENPDSFSTNWLSESSFPDEENPVLWSIVNKDFGAEGTHSGTNKIYCAGQGFWGTTRYPIYPDGTDNFFERQIDLTGFTRATLSFWYTFKVFEGNDDYTDEFSWDVFSVSVNDEIVFSTDYYETDVPMQVKVWTKKTLDLSAYSGGPCIVRFSFTSDSASQDEDVTAGKGVFVDDITMTGYPANRIDYHDDGSDLLLQDQYARLMVWDFAADGTYQGFEWMNGRKAVTGWKVAGQADFNRDGQADILWHSGGTGKTMGWLMSGIEKDEQIPMRKMALGWRVVGLADFNHDGTQDIVWQNAKGNLVVWYMNVDNPMVADAQVPFNKSVGTTYNVVAIVDCNSDGHHDLILQNKISGGLRARYLVGLNSLQATDPYVALTSPIKAAVAWRVMGTQDFNADGNPDLVLHHTNGTIVAWILDGLKVTEQRILKKTPLAYKLGGLR